MNNVSPRSFRVEVTMQHGIAIDLFPLKRDGLMGGGAALPNDVTHESYVLEKCRSALIYRKSRDLECTKIDILQLFRRCCIASARHATSAMFFSGR